MKHASRLLSLLVLTAAFVVLAGSSCGKKTAPEHVWQHGAFTIEPGNQKSYSLPGGITIDSLYGADDDIPASYTPLYMVVSNSNASNTTVTFPTGLVFDPGDAEYQYMMLLQSFSFTAAPGVNDSILVPTYCCNEDLSFPDDASFYTLAGIEWDRETEELFNLVSNKTLVDSASDLAQDALFEITDGDSLTDATRDALKALP